MSEKKVMVFGVFADIITERDQLRAELAEERVYREINRQYVLTLMECTGKDSADEAIKEAVSKLAERDALAAHVERLVGALKVAEEEIPDTYDTLGPGGYGDVQRVVNPTAQLIRDAIAATPAQSLEAVTATLKENVERLQKALEEERTRLEYDKKHRSHKDYVEVSVDELNERIEAIYSALFSTKEGA